MVSPAESLPRVGPASGFENAVEVARLAQGAPRAATAAFLARDAITIFGSFALPGLL
jgi:hypothetical protein